MNYTEFYNEFRSICYTLALKKLTDSRHIDIYKKRYKLFITLGIEDLNITLEDSGGLVMISWDSENCGYGFRDSIYVDVNDYDFLIKQK